MLREFFQKILRIVVDLLPKRKSFMITVLRNRTDKIKLALMGKTELNTLLLIYRTSLLKPLLGILLAKKREKDIYYTILISKTRV